MNPLCCTMMPPPKSSRRIKRESTIDADTVRRLIPAVNGLHWRNSLEIHKLLKDNKDFCIYYRNGEKINVEKLAGALPLHLLAVINAPDKFEYLLSGIRLLHTLCELTSSHSKLYQVLLGDCVLSAKMIDLVINTMVALGGNKKESWNSDKESLIEATMVASTLHLLHGFISSKFQHIVRVLLAHSKVDLFIEAAFGAVHNVVRSLEPKLLHRPSDQTTTTNFHCQQAEAALQFLHSLCQHKLFSDRVARNKDICGKGGLLMLAESILSLGVSTEYVGEAQTIASMRRIKAKVLSLLYHLFEEDESVSFIDEVGRAGNLHLAQPVVSEVLIILKRGLSKTPIDRSSPDCPKGCLLLNAMRLANVFSDDKNFRRFFTDHFSMILNAVFCLSNEDFVSMLCSSNLSSREDDATLEYDLFKSAGWVLSLFSCSDPPQFKLNFQNNLTMSSYAHQRTSLLVKIIANLHCFSPGICSEDDRNRFVNSFVSVLRKDPMIQLPNSSRTPVAQRITNVRKNLCSLLNQANYLIASDLDAKDLMMFRVFCNHLQPLIGFEPLNLNIERASENPNVRGKSLVEAGDLGQAFNNNVFEGSGSGEVTEDETQGKKRKRRVMNDAQMDMMEKAIADEPDVRRSSAWIRRWVEKLNQKGPSVSEFQLRNWMSNRRAKLARNVREDKQGG